MIAIPKGTKDMLPQDAYKWHWVENKAREVAALFGFREMRTPTFEHTELFTRGVGETTDIVNKEMYTFLDKGNRSMTLRPEGTAGVARAFIENGLAQQGLPMKAYYLASVFRYERPQNGRLREHHQFGVELYGSELPAADAEVIALAHTFLTSAGLNALKLNINSIGCRTCRAEYNAALKKYIGDNLADMCASCRDRFDRNPLRILDCKEEKCRRITAGAPKITDYLCDDCKAHFAGVQAILGGLLLVLENTGALRAEPERTDVYIAALGARAEEFAPRFAAMLRKEGIKTEFDLMGRGLKAQMKYADKCGARYAAVIGDDELDRGEVTLKNMATGESFVCAAADVAAAVKE